MNDPAPGYAVNEYTPDPSVVFDRTVGETYVRYARMLAARGYVQSTLGGMVVKRQILVELLCAAKGDEAGLHDRRREEGRDGTSRGKG